MDLKLQFRKKLCETYPTGFLPKVKSQKSPSKASVSHSHIEQPVDQGETRFSGRSRRWGDASEQVQKEVVQTILEKAYALGLGRRETAVSIGIARLESGFNPDAASHISSASGIGQFINKTGQAYGVLPAEKFEIEPNATALIAYTKDCFHWVRKKFQGITPQRETELVYACYHDGPLINAGGEEIARKNLLPWVETISTWLEKDCLEKEIRPFAENVSSIERQP